MAKDRRIEKANSENIPPVGSREWYEPLTSSNSGPTASTMSSGQTAKSTRSAAGNLPGSPVTPSPATRATTKSDQTAVALEANSDTSTSANRVPLAQLSKADVNARSPRGKRIAHTYTTPSKAAARPRAKAKTPKGQKNSTPLKASTPLKSRTPLKANSPIKTRTPIKAHTPKTAKSGGSHGNAHIKYSTPAAVKAVKSAQARIDKKTRAVKAAHNTLVSTRQTNGNTADAITTVLQHLGSEDTPPRNPAHRSTQDVHLSTPVQNGVNRIHSLFNTLCHVQREARAIVREAVDEGKGSSDTETAAAVEKQLEDLLATLARLKAGSNAGHTPQIDASRAASVPSQTAIASESSETQPVRQPNGVEGSTRTVELPYVTAPANGTSSAVSASHAQMTEQSSKATSAALSGSTTPSTNTLTIAATSSMVEELKNARFGLKPVGNAHGQAVRSARSRLW